MSRVEDTADVNDFLGSALAQWFTSCMQPLADKKITYEEIIDGPLLYHLFLKTCRTKFNDLRPSNSSSLSRHYPSFSSSSQFDDTILSSGGVTSIRSRNLETILTNLRSYYEELDRILVRLPNVSSLAREPRLHTNEAELILCLLLGCAINCDRQVEFIEGIRKLDEQVQFVIAQCVMKVQHEPGLVLDRNMLDARPGESKETHSKRMDDFFEAVRVLDRERNEYCLQLRSGKETRRADEAETNLRTTRRELERVIDELAEREDEIEQHLADIDKLKRDNEMLASEARSLIYYRDELDISHEKAAKADQLELEVSRLKVKLDELGYSKSKLDELHEEMRLFSLKKAALDEEVGSLRGETRAQSIKISSLEKRLEQTQRKLDRTSDDCRKRVEECEKLRRDNPRLARDQQAANKLLPLESSTSTPEPLSYSLSNADFSKPAQQFPSGYLQILLDQRDDLRRKLEEAQREIKKKDDAIDELKKACSVSLDENKRLGEEMKKLLENRQPTDPYRKVNKKDDKAAVNRSNDQPSRQSSEASNLPHAKIGLGKGMTLRERLDRLELESAILMGRDKEIGKAGSGSAYFKHTPVVTVSNRRRKIDSLVRSS